MSMRIPFVKMHGAGNDFVVIDALDGDRCDYAREAARLNDRHFGIGADQLLVIRPSARADVQMRIFNNDGSEVEMCGNGIRCLLKYLTDRGKVSGGRASVETLAGIIRPEMAAGGGVRVDMGAPILDGLKIPTTAAGRIINRPIRVGNWSWHFTAVSMGNPHAVFFIEDVQHFPVAEIGPKMEHDPLYPRRANVEFAQVIGPAEIKLRVWERGAGETLACGTGACAAAVAGNLNGKTGTDVKIHLPGGTLRIEWDGDPSHSVFMTGPAEEVFQGEIEVTPLAAPMNPTTEAASPAGAEPGDPPG